MRYRYKVRGLHCDTCVERVKWALAEARGVKSFDLDPVSQTVVMEFQGMEISDADVDYDRLQKRLRAAGGYSIDSPVPVFTRQEKIRWYIPPAVALFAAVLFAFARGAAIHGIGSLSIADLELDFLGGALIVFGLAKVATLKRFTRSFRSVDYIAKHIGRYATVYPLFEIGAGTLFLLRIRPDIVQWFVVGMLFSTVLGMIGPLIRKDIVSTGVLGGMFDVPVRPFSFTVYVLATLYLFIGSMA